LQADIQGLPLSSAQVLGLSRYQDRAQRAACPVSAVTGFRLFEIVA
jgi:hypothetical protein